MRNVLLALVILTLSCVISLGAYADAPKYTYTTGKTTKTYTGKAVQSTEKKDYTFERLYVVNEDYMPQCSATYMYSVEEYRINQPNGKSVPEALREAMVLLRKTTGLPILQVVVERDVMEKPAPGNYISHFKIVILITTAYTH